MTLLKKIRNSIGKNLLLQGKNVAVITYTNAATDEIINRLDYSPVYHISTIHSFVWDVIKYYQTDIKQLYCQSIREEVRMINEKLDTAKNKTTKTYLTNADKKNYQEERLKKAEAIERFVYNPNGSNPEYNALNHAEVIKISAQMIMNNLMLQQIIAQRYPILLIDESQDTKKNLWMLSSKSKRISGMCLRSDFLAIKNSESTLMERRIWLALFLKNGNNLLNR